MAYYLGNFLREGNDPSHANAAPRRLSGSWLISLQLFRV
jgi:hypothetical protein